MSTQYKDKKIMYTPLTPALLYEPGREKTGLVQSKTKMQISFAVTAKLISAFVLATQIVNFSTF